MYAFDVSMFHNHIRLKLAGRCWWKHKEILTSSGISLLLISLEVNDNQIQNLPPKLKTTKNKTKSQKWMKLYKIIAKYW